MTRAGRRAERLVATAIAASALMVASGCTGSEAEPDSSSAGASDPTDIALAFLRAQAEGDYATAIALSTSDPSDFACAWQVEDGQRGGIAAPAVDQVTVGEGGRAATAEVTYTSVGEVQATLTLTSDGDTWRVELPEAYEIRIAFAEPAVAELRFDVDGADSGCAVPATGGVISARAFPGTYAAHLVDPTGVADYGLGETLGVDGVDDAALEWGDAVDADALAILGGEVWESIVAGDSRCATGGAGSSPCPSGPGEALDPESFADGWSISRVWSADDRTWSFAASSTAGQLSGTLERDDDGALIPIFAQD